MNNQPADELEAEDFGKYKPNKRERAVRRKVYERYLDMRDDPQRKEAEKDWDSADKEFRMYIPDIDSDDWRSHLELPDSFAAIQTQMQETVERKSRPSLVRVEESDEARENFCNAVMNWNMDRTGFDMQYFQAKLQAAIRGTSFLKEYYRVEERTVKDPDDVDENGELVYKERVVTDFDDAYTEWKSTEWVFIDPAAASIDDASDCIEREILTIQKFRFKYGNRPGFKNVDMVLPGGDISRTRFFKTPQDLRANEVEILHYYNRDTDEYLAVANNVSIRDTPLPTKHKELPFATVYHYRVPGRLWGIGIPKVVKYLSEERKAIRRLNLDRQKLHLNKMFLVNNAYDLDEEDLESRPHGLISVETNGLPLSNVIQPLEYGDVPSSYFRTEEILLEDIRRAHGIDDRIQGVNVGGTATEAAILKESSLKRVNMISMLSEMDTIIRIGRLKWANIQFFYKAPRFEKIYVENGEEMRRVDRTVVVNDKAFSLSKTPGSDKYQLDVEEIEGRSVFKLDKKMARFMEGDLDVQMGSEVHTPFSKAIKQAKTTEMLTTILANPTLAGALDPTKSVKRYLEVNEEEPKDWMANPNTKENMIQLADLENEVMKQGYPLQGTEGATVEHTMIHLHYAQTAEYQQLDPTIQQIIQNHILEEHDNNPMTGSSAELMGGFGLSPGGALSGEMMGGAMAGPQNMVEGAPAPNIQPQVPGQMQAADLQPANNNPAPA